MKQMLYSEEQKRWVLDQMKVPGYKTVKPLFRVTGIAEVTLRA